MVKTTKANHSRGGTAARDGVSRLTSRGRRVAQNFKNANSGVKNATQQTLAELRGAAEDIYQQGRAKARDVEDTVEKWIVARPFTSTLVTLGVGLVLGRFWRRR